MQALKIIIRDIFSRPFFQFFFDLVLNFSLKVLNIGEGCSVETSGEKSVFSVLEKISGDKKVIVFDVGANNGGWFRLFRKYYKKQSVVYSFEPAKETFLELSRIKEDDFYPCNIALGDKIENKYLLSDKDMPQSTMAYVSDARSNNLNSEEISVTTLDQFCKENNTQNIDFLKLDVEGYEIRILHGAQEMLKNGKIKIIQFEFGAPSEEKYSLQDFFNILEKDYQICRVLKHGYYPIKKYKQWYEIMTVTNFIAIHRSLIRDFNL